MTLDDLEPHERLAFAGLVTIGGLPAPAEGYKLTLRGWLATHADELRG